MIKFGYRVVGILSSSLAIFEWYRICTVSKPTVTDWYAAIVLSFIAILSYFVVKTDHD
jgi:hypothetical protein